MSRRKQSNPKPLKREDEEDSQSAETGVKVSESSQSGSSSSSSSSSSISSSSSFSTSSSSSSSSSSISRSPPTSNQSKTVANSERPSSNPSTSPPTSGCESPVPRLRLNPSLATDPALRSEAMTVKAENLAVADAEVVATIIPPPPPPPPPPPLPPPSVPSQTRPLSNASAVEDLEYLTAVPVPPYQHALTPSPGRLYSPSQPMEKEALNLPTNRKLESPAMILENRTVPIFVCAPCGIRFSSASTLEAHQTYYCSHRAQVKGRVESDCDDPKSPQNGNDESQTPGKVLRTGKQYGCPHCSYSADKKVSLNRHMRMHSSSPAAQSSVALPLPVILPSDLHNGEEPPSPANPSHLVDRYCQDCDIRFYSVKTLKAHKMHYCSSRYAKPSSPPVKGISIPAASPTQDFPRLSPDVAALGGSPGRSADQPFLLLRTNPVLIVPYSLLQSASVFTGTTPNFPVQDAPCILMPNGTVQPMSNLVSHLSNERLAYPGKHGAQPKDELLGWKNARFKSEVGPLDLSVRRSPESNDLVIDMEDEKENVCAADLPGEVGSPNPGVAQRASSPPGKAPEGRRRSGYHSGTPSPNVSPAPHAKKSPRRTPNGVTGLRADVPAKRASSAGTKFLGPHPPVAARLPLVLPGASAELLDQVSFLPLLSAELRIPGQAAGGTRSITESSVPQVLVKQGVSKCQECNIVFCKHENYIAHKKHYCSARLHDLSSEENSRTSPVISNSSSVVNDLTDPVLESQRPQCDSPPTAKAKTLQYQFICVACSISFTSLDNLSTHQTFYCNKRPPDESVKQAEEKNRKCARCKALVNGDHDCFGSGANAPGSGWKCPCCEVVSPTAAAAQKHMDTHQGVRAFRCTICKYKGNTLRGMRTHIRMHFDKKSNDFQEEKFIGCILDEEDEHRSCQAQQSLQKQQDKQESPNHFRQPQPPQEQQQQLRDESNRNGDLKASQQVAVKAEIGPEDEFVEVDVVDPAVLTTPDHGRADSPGQVNNIARRVNYCEPCDISFNFLSSLIAHKKFYCSAGSVDSDVGEPKGSSRASPEASIQ